MSSQHVVLDGRMFGEDQVCFGCGPSHPHGFKLSFEREGDEVVTRFTPHHHHQGAPGIMHGGLVSTLADELAAWGVVVLLGKFGFTTHFNARFARAIRTGQEVEGRARLTGSRTRFADLSVVLRQSGETAFTGEFRFILLDERGAEKLLGAPLPEAWKTYCR